MMTTLEKLISALRNELQQYGEMLALLDHHQEIGSLNGSDDILLFISSINAQSSTIQSSRQGREAAQRELAQALLQPAETGLASLTPLLPEQYRPLVAALVSENDELLNRVKRRAEENQLVLRRSLDMMQRFLVTLSPTEESESHHTHPEFINGPPGSALQQAAA